MRPLVIGTAGGTGSGKGVLAEVLLNKLGRYKIALVQEDSYYKDLSHIPFEERKIFEEREIKNLDHPNALDNELFEDHLENLIARKAINAPIYDFSTHTRKKSTMRIESKDIIIVEGNFILIDNKLRKLIDFKIFLDVDSDIRFIRRLKRDINERGRTLSSVVRQ